MASPAAYIRKSKRADDSAAAQLAAVRQIAVRHGIDPDSLAVYDDNGRSGDRAKLKDRRGYHAMLDAVERGEVSAVLIRVLDRLGRDVEESLRFARVLKENGARIIDQVGEVDRDRLMFTIWAGEKELEAAKQRSAFTKAMRESRGDAAVGGHSAPYGFRHVRAGDAGLDGDPRRIVAVPNPDEPLEPILDAVRECGGSVLKAAKLLDDRGPKPRSGGLWEPRTLARIVDANNGARLRGKGRRAPSEGTAPLSRIVACHCGATMTPIRDPRNGQWLALYCSRGHKAGSSKHGRYHARARHVMDRLREDLAGTVESEPVDLVYDPSENAEERARLVESLRRMATPTGPARWTTGSSTESPARSATRSTGSTATRRRPSASATSASGVRSCGGTGPTTRSARTCDGPSGSCGSAPTCGRSRSSAAKHSYRSSSIRTFVGPEMPRMCDSPMREKQDQPTASVRYLGLSSGT